MKDLFIQVTTQKAYNALMEVLEMQGFKWVSDDLPTKNNNFRDEETTVIHLHEDKKISYCSRKWYENEGQKIDKLSLPTIKFLIRYFTTFNK